MLQLTVSGGRPLTGEVVLSGSKNAALPILFATLVTRGVSVLEDCPDIGDVRFACRILESFGARVERNGKTLTVDSSDLSYAVPPIGAVSGIRASSYLIGGCLARFGRCVLQPYGGCNFSARPIDMHIAAAKAVGATESGGVLTSEGLVGAAIAMPKVSVGTTVNAILLSVTAKGRSVLTGAAKEPHIDALIAYLNSAGGQIERFGDRIEVEGRGSLLGGGHAAVIPDPIEGGTYLLAAPITGGDITVRNVRPGDLGGFPEALRESGVTVIAGKDHVRAFGRPVRRCAIVSEPHPGFPTDLQPQFSVLLSKTGGTVEDRVFPERFGYLSALSAFGVSSSVDFSCGQAEIRPSVLRPAAVAAPDLRGGAACLLAALGSAGESRITSAEKLLRGYESLPEKLKKLGGCVTISETVCNNGSVF